MAEKRRKAPKGCYWRGNTLWGRISVKGVERRFSLRTDKTEVAEARLKAQREREVAASHFGDARPTWEDAVVAWGVAIGGHTKPSTRHRYMTSLTQMEPFLKGLYVDEIDKKIVGDIIRKRRADKASNATIRRDLTALSSVLAHAEEEGWIDSNPALAKAKRIKEKREAIVLPEPAHIRAVIARAPGQFAALIETAWLTGCRLDELRRLERQNLDFQRQQIALYKTKNSRPRFIEMGDAFAVLNRLPIPMGSRFVFWHGPKGDPYKNVSSNFRRLVAAAHKAAQKARGDFRPFRFHDLRHAYAVEALKKGKGIYALQQHLGHSSVQVTERYLDYLTAEEKEAAKRGAAQIPSHEQRSIAADQDVSA